VVDTRAQVVQRGSVGTDDDGVRDSVEEQTWRLPSGDGSKCNLSARDPDTDDDGLSDSEKVTFTRKVIGGELRVEPAYARSNPDFEDTGKVINEDLTAKDRYVNANDSNVKGAMYEMRVANGKLVDKLDGDATLKLNFEPEVGFDSLSSDEVSDIADELEVPECQARDELASKSPDDPNPEFDGVAIEADGKAVYYGAKSGDVPIRDIKGKLARLRAYQTTNNDVDSSHVG